MAQQTNAWLSMFKKTPMVPKEPVTPWTWGAVNNKNAVCRANLKGMPHSYIYFVNPSAENEKEAGKAVAGMGFHVFIKTEYVAGLMELGCPGHGKTQEEAATIGKQQRSLEEQIMTLVRTASTVKPQEAHSCALMMPPRPKYYKTYTSSDMVAFGVDLTLHGEPLCRNIMTQLLGQAIDITTFCCEDALATTFLHKGY